MKSEFKILLLDDGNKGNFVQSYGIASVFPSTKIEILKIEFKGPRYKLPGRKGNYPVFIKFFNLFCFFRMFKMGNKLLKLYSKNLKEFSKKKYDFIISSGSLLAPLNILLSKETSSYSIHLMVPSGMPLSLFDFLIIPYHDFLKFRIHRKNIIVTLGAPNLINEEMKKNELDKIPVSLKEKIKKKLITIVIGGDDQNYRISTNWVKNIKEEIDKMKENFQFFLTTSRRTNEKVIQYICENFMKDKNFLYIEIPTISKETLYPEILFISDIIMVTEDSINMISEAASTGKKVIILGVERKKKKKLIFDLTIEKFVEDGYAEYIPFTEIDKLPDMVKIVLNKKYKVLNEAKECVQKILKSIN